MYGLEKIPRKYSLPLVAMLGFSAWQLVSGPDKYDGWVGCDQAIISPGVANVRPHIDARIAELNNGTEQLKNGSMHFAENTNTDANASLHEIYAQLYGKGYVEVQSGDEVPFCVAEDGTKSFDPKGEFIVKNVAYESVDAEWQQVTTPTS